MVRLAATRGRDRIDRVAADEHHLRAGRPYHRRVAPSGPTPLPSPMPIVVIGGGLSGMATAGRLAVRGERVLLLEAHRAPGGCCGYFRRGGFAFDAGCTTLVDYRPGGVGGDLLETLGLPQELLEHLPGYLAWIGGRPIELHADLARWRQARAQAFGDTPAHRAFWALVDRVSAAFSGAARKGARLPISSFRHLVVAAKSLPPADWPLLRYLTWTVDDALRHVGLDTDRSLRRFVAMVVQDTVHGDPADAPFVNACLGLSIRGALTRPRGGMFGFWSAFEARVRELGVDVRLATRVERIERAAGGGFRIETSRGAVTTDVVVCTLPIWNAAAVSPGPVADALRPWCAANDRALGGALSLALGVREDEVDGQRFTHHQFLADPDAPLGDGNNCFLSISSPDDRVSAPEGHRAVMLSTHVDVEPWRSLDDAEDHARRASLAETMLGHARAAFPRLGSAVGSLPPPERSRAPHWLHVASPRTYVRFTSRHLGSVGGTRLSMANSNQRAVPHDIGVSGWVQAGDTTWPGLGTTACALGSLIAADEAQRWLGARRRT
jgi:phytoene dehydrogenase-like protein